MYKDKDKQREANKQAAQRRRHRAKGMTIIDEGVTKRCDVTGCDAPGVTVDDLVVDPSKTTVKITPDHMTIEIHEEGRLIGPLDVYSPARWNFLQSRGHKWNQQRQCSVRHDGIVGVTVPGDPGYKGVA